MRSLKIIWLKFWIKWHEQSIEGLTWDQMDIEQEKKEHRVKANKCRSKLGAIRYGF